MPYHVAKSGQCPVSKPWACLKTGTGEVMGCHASKGDAEAQMAALYANEPGGKSMTQPRQQRASVDSSPWDASKAWANGAASDSPAAFYKGICAGEHTSGDPGTQAHWALPHHYHPGDAPNAAGVRNALSRLPGTQSLKSKDAAQKHLDAHMSVISPDSAKSAGTPAEQRAAALGDRRAPGDTLARMEGFAASWQHRTVQVNGKQFARLDGYASVTGIEYEMWDMFGPYGETLHPEAFDDTLAAAPDVAFLVNHKGLTMARTKTPSGDPTLTLDADPRGLHALALVNPERNDVHDLLAAVDDQMVTEMSFAFMLEDCEWDEAFEHLTITRVNLDRGDVSAVNYGANPYTSIAARSREILGDLEHLPAGAQRAALRQLSAALGNCQCQLERNAVALSLATAPRSSEVPAGSAEATPRGRSVDYWQIMLRL